MRLVKLVISFSLGWMWALAASYASMVRRQIREANSVLSKVLMMILFFMIVPAVSAGGIAMIAAAVDQTTFLESPVAAEFTDPTLNDMSVREKASVLMFAATHQLRRELDTAPGWTVNDVAGMQWWDNRGWRQQGVIHATRELIHLLSPTISRYGSGDEEDQELLDARQSGLAYGPAIWGWYNLNPSEDYYLLAISEIDSYRRRVVSDPPQARANITTANLKAILDLIDDRVLGVPYGRLIQRNESTPWSQLDDHVYYAQGAAIVARDMLSALRHSFTDELNKGGIENLDAAIRALEAVASFNPLVVTRGDHDAVLADHRSKLASYFSLAIKRVEDLAASLLT